MNYFESLISKIYPDRNLLKEELDAFRKGKTIVFTNGCFDLIHPGHVTYLNRARDLGDALIVAVNSDDSVSKLKGPTRPINTVRDRSLVLAGLAAVDFVTVFSEDTPEETLGLLQPDIHSKGGDYQPEELPEKAVIDGYGGRIVIIPFLEGYSTTSILRRK